MTAMIMHSPTLAQGLSNIVGGFFSGYLSAGSFTRSGLSYEAGACSPLAGVMP